MRVMVRLKFSVWVSVLSGVSHSSVLAGSSSDLGIHK